MEPDNSHIGKQFRDAFAEFRQEPSPELWNKIATHPDFPATPVKPRLKWGRILAGSTALIAIVSIVLFTVLPSGKTAKSDLKQPDHLTKSEAAPNVAPTDNVPANDLNHQVGKENSGKPQNNVATSSNQLSAAVSESVNPEKTLGIPAKLGKQSVIQTNTTTPLPNNTAIVAQRQAITNSSVKEILTSPASSEPLYASSDTMLCLGESMLLQARGGDFYSWNTGETSSSIQINPTELTSYTVTVTSHTGRQLIKEIQVKVNDCQPLSIPNAFTPNADGVNDIFEVYGNDILNFSMIILTRTGQIVFESKDIKTGWDGSIKGKPAELGVYIYRIQYTDQYGTERKQNGQITLLR